jgi:hypothetical protein
MIAAPSANAADTIRNDFTTWLPVKLHLATKQAGKFVWLGAHYAHATRQVPVEYAIHLGCDLIRKGNGR